MKNKTENRTDVATPNDPKLSDDGGWRAGCAVGERRRLEAASVTAGAVRCSAWLGVSFLLGVGECKLIGECDYLVGRRSCSGSFDNGKAYELVDRTKKMLGNAGDWAHANGRVSLVEVVDVLAEKVYARKHGPAADDEVRMIVSAAKVDTSILHRDGECPGRGVGGRAECVEVSCKLVVRISV